MTPNLAKLFKQAKTGTDSQKLDCAQLMFDHGEALVEALEDMVTYAEEECASEQCLVRAKQLLNVIEKEAGAK